MLELGAGADLFRAAGWLFIIFVLLCLAGIAWLATKGWPYAVGALLVLLAFSYPVVNKGLSQRAVETAYEAKYQKAKTVFEERCKTAGEKIYRTTENVEAVLLVNARVAQSATDWKEQDWIGAGMPLEATGNAYINSFLFYDIAAADNGARYLSPGGTVGAHGTIVAGIKPKGIRGYSYLEVKKSDERHRYSLRPLTDYDLGQGPLDGYGKMEVAKGSSPRYAVVYENINDLEGRTFWVAGARVKVIDQTSGELMGERIQYSFETGFGSTHGGRPPWPSAHQCPAASHSGTTRYFVQKILNPIQGN